MEVVIPRQKLTASPATHQQNRSHRSGDFCLYAHRVPPHHRIYRFFLPAVTHAAKERYIPHTHDSLPKFQKMR